MGILFYDIYSNLIMYKLELINYLKMLKRKLLKNHMIKHLLINSISRYQLNKLYKNNVENKYLDLMMNIQIFKNG